MNQIYCECKVCTERKVTLTYNCHDHCPKYKAFQALCEKARRNEITQRSLSFIPVKGECV